MSHDQVVWQELNLNSSTIQDVNENLSNLNLRGQIEFENDQSPLVAAVEANRKDLLTLMIEEFGLNVNSTVKNGGDRWCALAAAIVKQDKEMVQFLVNDMEADVNILIHLRRSYLKFEPHDNCNFDLNKEKPFSYWPLLPVFWSIMKSRQNREY